MAERKLWFKAKRYGWGWHPASWQGWLCVAAYVAAICTSSWLMAAHGASDDIVLGLSFLAAICATAALIAICWARGEAPRWRWGKRT